MWMRVDMLLTNMGLFLSTSYSRSIHLACFLPNHDSTDDDDHHDDSSSYSTQLTEPFCCEYTLW